MNCKCNSTTSGKSFITSEFEKGKSTLELSKIIGTYHQTMKKLVAAPMKVHEMTDKGHLRIVSQNHLSQIKCEAVNNPGRISRELSRCVQN